METGCHSALQQDHFIIVVDTQVTRLIGTQHRITQFQRTWHYRVAQKSDATALDC